MKLFSRWGIDVAFAPAHTAVNADARRGRYVMAMGFKQHLTAWAREQGVREYKYTDPQNCALCQFLNNTGRTKSALVGPIGWQEFDDNLCGPVHTISDDLHDALVGLPHNFAALADRLSA